MNIFWQSQQEVDDRNPESPELVDITHYYIFTDYFELMPQDEVVVVEYSERYGVYTRFWVNLYKHWSKKTFVKYKGEFNYAKFFEDVFEKRIEEN